MLFEVWHQFRLKSCQLKVEEDGPVVIRKIRLKVERAFDEEIAAALGSDGPAVREGLATGGIAKAVLPIDAIVVEATLRGPAGEVSIPRMKGIKAIGDAPKSTEPDDENGDPKVTLEFETGFAEDIWVFLGRNGGAWAEIKLVKTQLSLIDGREAAAS